MRIQLVEHELTCPTHGAHRMVTPAGNPVPRRCAHCFLDLTGRAELRRYTVEGPVKELARPETWVG